MRLNTLSPQPGSKNKAKRVGRGIGSGLGKTCGLGHKGQKARKSGGVRPGFEGGQMPIQRRLPKFGFTSMSSLSHEKLRSDQLDRIVGDLVNIETLKNSGLIRKNTKTVKVYLAGELNRALVIADESVKISKGVLELLNKAGGRVEGAAA